RSRPRAWRAAFGQTRTWSDLLLRARGAIESQVRLRRRGAVAATGAWLQPVAAAAVARHIDLMRNRGQRPKSERGAVVVVRVAPGGAGAAARAAHQRLGLAAIAYRRAVLVAAPRRPAAGDQPPAPLAAAGRAGCEQVAGFPPGEHHLTRHVGPPIV